MEVLEFELRKASREGDIEQVKKCIEGKVDVNASSYGLASIHSASLEGFVEIVKLLVQAGANLEAVDGLGKIIV